MFLIHFHYQFLIVGNGELGQGKHGTLVLLSLHTNDIVERTQRINHLFLHGGTPHYLLVHYLESHEIHVKRHMGGISHLGMEIEQVSMRIKSFEQEPYPEALAADVFDPVLVLLVYGFHDQTYQTR